MNMLEIKKEDNQVEVQNKLKGLTVSVRKAGTGAAGLETMHRLDLNDQVVFNIPKTGGDVYYLELSPRVDISNRGKPVDYEIVIPLKVNYEFDPGGSETLEITSTDVNTVLTIHTVRQPCKLRLKLDANLGPDNTVTVVEKQPGLTMNQNFVEKIENEKVTVISVDEFLESLKWKPRMDPRERERILDQSQTLLDHFYVHLYLKQSKYAVNPLQGLRLLKRRHSNLSDREFHGRVVTVFTGLRDLHTHCVLPRPYWGSVAFLPFLVEEYGGGAGKKYMVSKVFRSEEGNNANKGEKDDLFKEEVEITHWNGVPIDRAVAVNGELNAGGNDSARHARGLERMTIRPLTSCLYPLEDWVEIQFRDENGRHDTRRFSWQVADFSREQLEKRNSRDSRVETGLGGDVETEMVRRMKKVLFYPGIRKAGGLEWEDIIPQKSDRVDGESEPADPYLAFSLVTIEKVKFGYLRIYSFYVDEVDYFVETFGNKIGPRLNGVKGLIVDIRGNGGGLIPAAERLLQCLKPEDIKSMDFQFINTDLTHRLCSNVKDKELNLGRWAASIEEGLETGEPYSRGFPLEPEPVRETVKAEIRVKQKQLNIVLITDALCYSAAEIFAAGFQDNEIGKIIGVHERTGGGGANMWSHDVLYRCHPQAFFDDILLKPLPGNCELNIAIRRAVRGGNYAGSLIEDIGVKADCIVHLTKKDLLERNADLIRKAARVINNLNNGKDMCECGKEVTLEEDQV